MMSKTGDGWMDESHSNRVIDAGDDSPDLNPTCCHPYSYEEGEVKEKETWWLKVDGSFAVSGSGAEIVMTSLEGTPTSTPLNFPSQSQTMRLSMKQQLLPISECAWQQVPKVCH